LARWGQGWLIARSDGRLEKEFLDSRNIIKDLGLYEAQLKDGLAKNENFVNTFCY